MIFNNHFKCTDIMFHEQLLFEYDTLYRVQLLRANDTCIYLLRVTDVLLLSVTVISYTNQEQILGFFYTDSIYLSNCLRKITHQIVNCRKCIRTSQLTAQLTFRPDFDPWLVRDHETLCDHAVPFRRITPEQAPASAVW